MLVLAMGALPCFASAGVVTTTWFKIYNNDGSELLHQFVVTKGDNTTYPQMVMHVEHDADSDGNIQTLIVLYYRTNYTDPTTIVEVGRYVYDDADTTRPIGLSFDACATEPYVNDTADRLGYAFFYLWDNTSAYVGNVVNLYTVYDTPANSAKVESNEIKSELNDKSDQINNELDKMPVYDSNKAADIVSNLDLTQFDFGGIRQLLVPIYRNDFIVVRMLVMWATIMVLGYILFGKKR